MTSKQAQTNSFILLLVRSAASEIILRAPKELYQSKKLFKETIQLLLMYMSIHSACKCVHMNLLSASGLSFESGGRFFK